MNSILIKNNYLIIRNFIESDRAKQLSKDFKEECKKENAVGDILVLDCQGMYNYMPFLELLCEKIPEISEITEEIILPTYSYARVYRKGNILEAHKDRPSCEISLSVHLDGDISWPIWVETPEGKKEYVSLNSGDALLYLGCIAEHGREIFTGEWYTQVFLHYVRSRGPNSSAYFDNRKKFLSP
jgi:hypothetical protein